MTHRTSGVPQSPPAADSIRLKKGFTIVELLVVIGIITILVSLLVPAVGRVRRKAQEAATQAFMSQLAQAIDSYNNDFRSYPGPLTNDEVYSSTAPRAITVDPAVPAADWITTPSTFNEKITMSENLVLGLLGGLRYDAVALKTYYDPRLIGGGPNSLKTSGPVKHTQAYLEAKNLSWNTGGSGTAKTGQYMDDDNGKADDTFIPEFVDNYSNPMPILYLRAKKGSNPITGTLTAKDNSIISYDSTNATRVGHYDLHQIIGYTSVAIGSGRSVTPVNIPASVTTPHGLSTVDPKAILTSSPADTNQKAQYHYPFDAYPYFRNPALSSPADGTSDYGTATDRSDVPHQKDGYILISAGIDRVYGTTDDVTNFGSVGGK